MINFATKVQHFALCHRLGESPKNSAWLFIEQYAEPSFEYPALLAFGYIVYEALDAGNKTYKLAELGSLQKLTELIAEPGHATLAEHLDVASGIAKINDAKIYESRALELFVRISSAFDINTTKLEQFGTASILSKVILDG